MAPPSAYDDAVETGVSVRSHGRDQPGTATLETGMTYQQAAKHEVKMQLPTFRSTEKDPYKEREYQKGRLALAFRIFAKFGFDEGVAGHITLRVNFPRFTRLQWAYLDRTTGKLTSHSQDPVEPDSFWVNPFGVAWPLLKASDLIRVNRDGKVVEGGPCRMLNAAGKRLLYPTFTPLSTCGR